MITKGIIQNIDYLSNTCTIRIPLFEPAGSKRNFEVECGIMSAPGVYNNYQVNDVVVVGFGPAGPSDPIVLGKLYLGAAKEKDTRGGAVNCTDLSVSNSAILPADTRIAFGDIFNDTTSARVAELNQFTQYKSFKDIFNTVIENSNNINKLSTTNSLSNNSKDIGTWVDNKPLRQQVIELTSKDIISGKPDYTCEIKLDTTNENIDILWIDSGKSFILDSNSKYTDALGNYNISKKADENDNNTIHFYIKLTKSLDPSSIVYLVVLYTLNF